MKNLCQAFCCSVGFGIGMLLQTSGAEARGQSEEPGWQFRDSVGQMHSPFEDLQTDAIVLVFVSVDCPIANAYQPLLQRMQKQYAGPDFRWFFVYPNPATTAESAEEHARVYSIACPRIIDREHALTRRAGVRVTPEVAVFLRNGKTPAYRGRIDDQYPEFGKKRAAATTHELADALHAVAEGKPVLTAETEAVGCFIEPQQPDRPATAVPADASPAYDPLAFGPEAVEELLLDVVDSSRDRTIPLRVYLPRGAGAPAPVVLFSHGLGGNRDGSPFLGRHWAGRGYLAVFLQHPGSDDSVWKDTPVLQRMAAMREAAGARNFSLRVRDVPAVLDQLEKWNTTAGHPLEGRIDPERTGMSGHSFGAVTTQAVSGQSYRLVGARFTDPRIDAAVVMSPSSPASGSAGQAFGKIGLPWLLMTGTDDLSVIGEADMESRLAVFPALPPGNKFELVLDKAEHSAFTERALPNDRIARNPNHHRAILALSTAFWDAWLKGDPAARTWLEDEAAVRKVLEPADRWQRK